MGDRLPLDMESDPTAKPPAKMSGMAPKVDSYAAVGAPCHDSLP